MSNSKIIVKTVIGCNSITLNRGNYIIQNIIDTNVNTLWWQAAQSSLPYNLTFTFNSVVAINKIVLHSIGNMMYDAQRIVLYKTQNDALANSNIYIQSFDIQQTNNNYIGGQYGDFSGVNANEVQSVLSLSTPYIGDSITLWVYPNNHSGNIIAIREIDFLT